MRAKCAAQDDEALKAIICRARACDIAAAAKWGEAVKTGTIRNAHWALAPSILRS